MVTVADVDMRNWYEHPDGFVYDGNYPLSARPGAGTLNINDSLHGLASDNVTLFSERQNLIFEEDFETLSRDDTHWYTSGNAPTYEALNGRNAMRVWLDRDNTGNESPSPERTEVVLSGISSTYFDDGISARVGSTYWYGVSIYVDPDFVLDSIAGEILCQWHGRPNRDISPKEVYRNPCLALKILGDDYRIFVAADSKLISGLEPDAPTYDRREEIVISSGGVTPSMGKWTNWVFKIKFQYDSTGTIDIYQDGVLIYSEANKANCYNDPDKGAYFKMGLYKSQWDFDKPESATRTRLYYHDNFRLGNSNATLADVWQDES